MEAARRLVLAGSESALTAQAVAREAGVGGATFYEHFRNRKDLLRALSEELFDDLRLELQEPRRQAIAAPSSDERLREEFRRPLEILVANPALFRLAMRARHAPGTPLEVGSRELRRNTRTDLVEELMERGYPNRTPAQRRRLDMVADIHIAATEALALGHLAGRYPDLDEIADMLVLMTRGTRLVRTLDD